MVFYYSIAVSIYHCYLLFMKHNLYVWKANKMSFYFVVRLNFEKKKLTSALFENDFCSPKVTAPLKLRPPKAANSESNEGHYYRNSTVAWFEPTVGKRVASGAWIELLQAGDVKDWTALSFTWSSSLFTWRSPLFAWLIEAAVELFIWGRSLKGGITLFQG